MIKGRFNLTEDKDVKRKEKVSTTPRVRDRERGKEERKERCYGYDRCVTLRFYLFCAKDENMYGLCRTESTGETWVGSGRTNTDGLT